MTPASRRLFLAGAVGFVAAAGGAGLYVWRAQRATQDAVLLTQSLPDTAGREQAFEQWRGKILVVNFWATWCEPCREEIPLFVRLQEKYGPRGLQFVGVAIDQPDKVTSFVRDFHINYPIVIGGVSAMEWARRLGNRNGGLPFTVVGDRSGRAIGEQLGVMTEEKLLRFIGDRLS